MLTHGNLYSNARDVGNYLQIAGEDRVITTLPVFHVFALTVVVNAPLMKGATLLLAPRFSPGEIFKLADEYKATVFAGVPTMFNFLYQFEEGDPKVFSHLRLAISGVLLYQLHCFIISKKNSMYGFRKAMVCQRHLQLHVSIH